MTISRLKFRQMQKIILEIFFSLRCKQINKMTTYLFPHENKYVRFNMKSEKVKVKRLLLQAFTAKTLKVMCCQVDGIVEPHIFHLNHVLKFKEN